MAQVSRTQPERRGLLLAADLSFANRRHPVNKAALRTTQLGNRLSAHPTQTLLVLRFHRKVIQFFGILVEIVQFLVIVDEWSDVFVTAIPNHDVPRHISMERPLPLRNVRRIRSELLTSRH